MTCESDGSDDDAKNAISRPSLPAAIESHRRPAIQTIQTAHHTFYWLPMIYYNRLYRLYRLHTILSIKAIGFQ